MLYSFPKRSTLGVLTFEMFNRDILNPLHFRRDPLRWLLADLLIEKSYVDQIVKMHREPKDLRRDQSIDVLDVIGFVYGWFNNHLGFFFFKIPVFASALLNSFPTLCGTPVLFAALGSCAIIAMNRACFLLVLGILRLQRF